MWPFRFNKKIRLHNLLEIMVSDHCNLTCEACDHASPIMPDRFEDPQYLHDDLSILSRYYQPDGIKLIGGEPTLHPDLGALIGAVKKSGISETIRLVTNGTHLEKLDDHLLKEIDTIEISIYPAAKLKRKEIEHFDQRAARQHTTVELFTYKIFHAQFSFPGMQDRELVQQVYQTCKRSQVWYCHAIYNGYFYKCPQSIYHQKINPALKSKDVIDAIRIEDNRQFAKQLERYLDDHTPLRSCRYCLGTVGQTHSHTMARPDHWLDLTQHSGEQLVDHELLEQSMVERDSNADMKIRTDIHDPALRD